MDATVAVRGDALEALDCEADRTTLLTNRRIIDIHGGISSETVLSDSLPTGLVSAVLVTDHHIFVGLNRGEWGGGLHRIDRRSGQLIRIESNTSGSLCGGPLNAACDPVNGLAVIPWEPNCIAAAVGLVHLVSDGRIVEICGAGVERLYEKVLGDGPRTAHFENRPASESLADDEPSASVAFFGLAGQAKALLAAGIDGIYRFEGGAIARGRRYPEWKNYDGIHASFEIPGVVLVLTELNQRASISGSVPLLIPR